MAENGIIKLARMLKDRENPDMTYNFITTGEVIGINPYKIRLDKEIILEQEDLLFASNVVENIKKYEILKLSSSNNSTNIGDLTTQGNVQPITDDVLGIDIRSKTSNRVSLEIKLEPYLNEGDEVIIIPTYDKQKWYVIDKVVSL